jgi:hypothetical protein
MTITEPSNSQVYIGFALFVVSELIGISRLKSNSILQLALHLAQELFPYEVKRRGGATRSNRPRRRRDEQGRYLSE